MNNSDKPNSYLKRMGIEQWVPQAKQSTMLHDEESIEASVDSMSWETLEQTVKSCQRCPLHQTRTHAVFGVGRRDAELFIIGEAPGMHEDKQGEPFVGRAGQLLNAMLKAIQLDRGDVYIANVLKSRPPRNRDPSAAEVAACTPYLLRQITLLRPKVLLAVGRIAAQYLLATDEPMGQLRGKEFEYGPLKTKLLITYHPAYLLRAPREKRKAWQDMQQLHALLQRQSR